MPQIVSTLEEALSPIINGCQLAVPRENSGVAMAATRAAGATPRRHGEQRPRMPATSSTST
jgi:hypothetical protein